MPADDYIEGVDYTRDPRYMQELVLGLLNFLSSAFRLIVAQSHCVE